QYCMHLNSTFICPEFGPVKQRQTKWDNTPFHDKYFTLKASGIKASKLQRWFKFLQKFKVKILEYFISSMLITITQRALARSSREAKMIEVTAGTPDSITVVPQ